MPELGTYTPFSTRVLAVYWLKKKIEQGMNHRGIMRTFHKCARALPKIEI